MTDNDWPTIQCPPGPTDAELEAERDTKHLQAVTEWFRLEWLMAGITAGAVALAPTAGAFPVVGGGGLTANAAAIVQYVQNAYPNVQSIGGVRQDYLPDHPSGRAVDIMIGGNMGLGDAIAADLRSQAGRFNITYCLWRVANHFNHVHCSVAY